MNEPMRTTEVSATIKLDKLTELPAGSGRVYTVGSREVAVFNVDGQLYAIDDQCPHQQASLATGTLDGSTVTCPWHGWSFDVRTGKGVGRPGSRVDCFDVSVDGDEFFIDEVAAEAPQKNGCDGIHRYLIRYGTMGWIGRFGSIERIECSFKDRVVVETGRGLEIGEVLSVPGENGDGSTDEDQPAGEILRRLTAEECTAADQPAAAAIVELFNKCRGLCSVQKIAAEVIDCERLFDGETVVLYYLGEPSGELQILAEKLGQQFDVKVAFHPVIEPPPSAGGCGSGGCGSGGCGSGGCGS